MLNIFSCVFWPSICLLRKIVCLDLLPIFWWGCGCFVVVVIELQKVFQILEFNPLSVASFAKIFSHSVSCLFVLFSVSFSVQKLLNLITSHLFIFVFIVITLGGRSEKILLCLCRRAFCLRFPLSVLYLGLESILSSFLCMVLGRVLPSFFSMWLSSLPSTTYWRDCLFSIGCSCLLFHRLVDCRCVGLILGFLSYSTDLYFCLCARTTWFWWL